MVLSGDRRDPPQRGRPTFREKVCGHEGYQSPLRARGALCKAKYTGRLGYLRGKCGTRHRRHVRSRSEAAPRLRGCQPAGPPHSSRRYAYYGRAPGGPLRHQHCKHKRKTKFISARNLSTLSLPPSSHACTAWGGTPPHRTRFTINAAGFTRICATCTTQRPRPSSSHRATCLSSAASLASLYRTTLATRSGSPSRLAAT